MEIDFRLPDQSPVQASHAGDVFAENFVTHSFDTCKRRIRAHIGMKVVFANFFCELSVQRVLTDFIFPRESPVHMDRPLTLILLFMMIALSRILHGD